MRHDWEHCDGIKTTCMRCGMRRELMPAKTRKGPIRRRPIFSADGVEWLGVAGSCTAQAAQARESRTFQ